MLKSFPIVSVGKPTRSSEEYMEIFGKVEAYFEPIWSVEILLTLFVGTCWFIGCVTSYWWLSILTFSLAQILIGWVSHSAVHNRTPALNTLGRF